MASETSQATISRQVLLFALLTGLGVWSYWPTLTAVVHTWWSSADYTHGFLIVPVGALLLWTTRIDAPPASEWRISPAGLWLLALAAGIRVLAGRVYLPELDAWSFPIWIAAATWTIFGWRTLVWSAPSVLLLCFAAPLPASVENIMGAPLRSLGASLSSVALRTLGEPAVAEGATILLNEHRLDVQQACSGLRMFYGIAALAVCCVTYFRPPAWQAAMLLLATLPIAILTNVLRIVVLALLNQQFPGEIAEQLGHDYAGLIVIPAAFGALLLVRKGLRAFQPSESDESPAKTERGESTRRGWAPATIISVVVLVGAFALISRQHNAAVANLSKSAASFAGEGEWSKAIDYLERALQLQPHDVSLLVQIGDAEAQNLATLHGKRRAFSRYQQAHRLDAGNTELGWKAARAAYDAERFKEASAIGSRLLRTVSDPAMKLEVIRLRADAAFESARRRSDWPTLTPDELAALSAGAELENPSLRHVTAIVADLDRRMAPSAEDPLAIEADRLLDRLTQQRPLDPGAWLARYQYAKRRALHLTDAALTNSLRESAANDLKKAIAVAEEHPGLEATEVYLAAANQALDAEESTSAASYFRQAIKASPADFRAYLALAKLLAEEDRLEEACSVLQQGLAARSGIEITLALRLAMYRARLEQFGAAESTLASLKEIVPQIPVAMRTEIRLAVSLVENEIIERRDGVEAALTQIRSVIALAQSDPAGVPSSQLLGQGLERYGRLLAGTGWHEMAAQTLLSAAKLNALSTESSQVLANSAALIGDLQLAKSTYSQLLKSSPQDMTLAAQELSVAIRERALNATPSTKWRDLEARLQSALRLGLNPSRAALLSAEITAVREGADAAARSLKKAAAESPEDPLLWRGLSMFRLQAGEVEGALEAARRYIALSPQEREPRRFYCRLLTRADRLDEAAEEIRKDLDELAQAGKCDMESWLTLADIELRRDDRKAAVRALTTAAEEAPQQIRPIQAMAEIAAADEDWPQVEKLGRQLFLLEGESGVYWRLYGAQRYLAAATNRNDETLRSAASASQQLLRLRSEWSEAHFLQGEVERRLENTAAASREYQSAWRRGKRTPLVADRLLETLVKLNRFEEASAFLFELREMLGGSPRLFDRVTALALESKSTDRLIEVARSYVERSPTSAEARLRLARVLLIAASMGEGEPDRLREEAKSCLRDAVRLQPQSLEVWKAAAVLGLDGGRSPLEVAAWIEELRREAPLDDISRSYVLALAFEGAGHNHRAAIEYLNGVVEVRKAESSPSLSIPLLLQASRFFRAVSPYLAERLAREALSHSDNTIEGKIALAKALMARRGAEGQALELLGEVSTSVGDAEDVLLTRCRLLKQRGTPADIDKAIGLLETNLKTSREKKSLLAELYESRGDYSSALTLHESLTDSRDATTDDLIAFLRFWQIHCLSESEIAFVNRSRIAYRTLASQSPTEWLRWKVREMKVRNEEQPGQSSIDAATLFAEAVRESTEDITVSRLSELLLVMLEEEASEAVYQIAKSPPSEIASDRVATAVCNAILMRDSQVLRRDHAPLIERVVALYPDLADVWQASGDYYLVMGLEERSQLAYRKTLEIEPTRSAVYNNLAVAYAAAGAGEQAEAWLDRAAEAGYGRTGLEDTRAWLRLTEGEPQQALEVLDSLSEAEWVGDATIQLHRAMAFDGISRDAEATMAFERSLSLGVERRTLLPLERRFVQETKLKVSKQEVLDLAASASVPNPVAQLPSGR